MGSNPTATASQGLIARARGCRHDSVRNAGSGLREGSGTGASVFRGRSDPSAAPSATVPGPVDRPGSWRMMHQLSNKHPGLDDVDEATLSGALLLVGPGAPVGGALSALADGYPDHLRAAPLDGPSRRPGAVTTYAWPLRVRESRIVPIASMPPWSDHTVTRNHAFRSGTPNPCEHRPGALSARKPLPAPHRHRGAAAPAAWCPPSPSWSAAETTRPPRAKASSTATRVEVAGAGMKRRAPVGEDACSW